MPYTGKNILNQMSMAHHRKQRVHIRRGKFGLKYDASNTETYDVIQDNVDIVIANFPSDAQLLQDGSFVDIPDYKGRLFAPITDIERGDIVDRNTLQTNGDTITNEPLLFVVDVNHPYNSDNMSLDLRSEVQN